MGIAERLTSKEWKAKEKTAWLAESLLDGQADMAEVLEFAVAAKEPDIANCMEACEYATSRNAELATPELLGFATRHLGAKAPRLRWESGKVIGNIARLYPDRLEPAVAGLRENAKHEGAVVRWSAAYALTQILQLPLYRDNDLFRTMLGEIRDTEEKDSIKKLYAKAL